MKDKNFIRNRYLPTLAFGLAMIAIPGLSSAAPAPITFELVDVPRYRLVSNPFDFRVGLGLVNRSKSSFQVQSGTFSITGIPSDAVDINFTSSFLSIPRTGIEFDDFLIHLSGDLGTLTFNASVSGFYPGTGQEATFIAPTKTMKVVTVPPVAPSPAAAAVPICSLVMTRVRSRRKKKAHS